MALKFKSCSIKAVSKVTLILKRLFRRAKGGQSLAFQGIQGVPPPVNLQLSLKALSI
jgi:hypothetical protein